MNKMPYDRDKANRILDAAKQVSDSCEDLFIKKNEKPIRVYWQSLVELPVGKRIYVGDGIWMTKVESIFHIGMTFFVEMPDGSSFNFHDHDCYEWFKVIIGEIIGVDTEVFYDPGVAHDPKAKGDTTLLVRLSKTKMYK